MKKSLLVFCSLISLFTSCIPPYAHIPQTHNTPLFTDKKQLNANVATNIRSLDLQCAYSPIKHLAVMGNLQFHKLSFMPEIAAGGYYSINDIFVAEFYAGVGSSRLNYSKSYRTGVPFFNSGSRTQKYTADIRSSKFFIQPDIGIKFNYATSLSLSCKISYWNYSKYFFKYDEYQFDGSNRTLNITTSIEDIKNPGKQVTYEPACTFRSGTEYFSFMLQAGFAIPKQDPTVNLNPYTGLLAFARVGVTLNLDFNAEKTPQKAGSKEREDRNFINSGHY